MRFLEDVMHQLTSCQSAVCLGWHAALVVGAFAMGLWLARELSMADEEEEPEAGAGRKEVSGVLRREPEPAPEIVESEVVEMSPAPDPGWFALPPETFTEVVLVEPHYASQGDGPRLGGEEEGGKSSGHVAMSGLDRGAPAGWEGADDLTLVRGISRMIEGGLRSEGIRTYADMARCPPERWREITGILGLADAAAAGEWVGQARELARLVASIREPGNQGNLPSAALLDGWFAGEEILHDAKLGPVYRARPAVVDRLTDLEGLSEAWAEALGRIGIYRFKQIAHWTDRQVDEIAERLAIPREVIDDAGWVARAMLRHLDAYRASPIWASARPEVWRYEELLNQYPIRDAVETDEFYGVIYLRAPEVGDDLTRIEGIDPGLAAWLGACGIYRFRQIADWSEANVDAFAVRLELPAERIYSERWIPQAAELAFGARRGEGLGTTGGHFGVVVGEGIE